MKIQLTEQSGLKDLQKEKDRSHVLEKQANEMKSLILHNEALFLKQEQAFNEVMQVCARYSKNDKTLMQKLREVKIKYQEGGSNSESKNGIHTSTTDID